MDFAFPDVCLTPVGPAIVPIPYPNFNMSTMGIPTQFRFFVQCMPGHNMTTNRSISMGDNGGLSLGLLSGLVMALGAALMGCFKFFVGGPPATKMTMPTKQNGVSPNAFGTSLSPSQIRLLSLS